MGAKCCANRKDNKPPIPKKPNDKDKKQRSIKPGARERNLSIGGTTDDAKKFDAAFEKNDINSFVKLLSSTQPIAEFEEPLHPWAEDPKTVGTLAATQLAIMSSSAGNAATKVKDDIRKAGAIPPLVKFLESKEKDRQQCAIVALAELTRDSAENSKAAGSAGGIGALMKHKDSPIREARDEIANIVRNIFMEDDDYREQFVAKGGVSFFIKQLNAAAELKAQLDAILNLTDLLKDGAGEINEDIVDQFMKAGVDAKLQGMEDTKSVYLKDAIKDLRNMLSGKTTDEEVKRCSTLWKKHESEFFVRHVNGLLRWQRALSFCESATFVSPQGPPSGDEDVFVFGL